MAGLLRKTLFQFALSASNNGQFGSAQLGTKVLSNDPLVIQGTTGSGSTLTPSTAWATGWLDAVIGGNNLPPLEEMQGLQYTHNYNISYLLARGLPEYDSGTTYNTGDITRPAASSQLYQSLIDANVANALPSAVTNANWKYLGDLSNLGTNNSIVYYGGTTGGTANAQTLTSTGYTLTAGNVVAAIIGNTNTAAFTLNANSLGAKNVYIATSSGPAACRGGEAVAGNLALFQYDGAEFQLLNPSVRTVLRGATSFYVNGTTGNDTNNGSSGSPWATIQHGANWIANNVDPAGNTVTLQVSTGTYAENVIINPLLGDALIILQGDTATPDNVIISPASGVAVTVTQTTNSQVQGFKLISSGSSGICLAVSQGGYCVINKLDFGAATQYHVYAVENAAVAVNAAGSYVISGSAVAHWLLRQNSTLYCVGAAISLSGTPNFSNAFVVADHCATVICLTGSTTFSGAATGARYNVLLNGVVDSGGGGASFFPGNAGGTAATGGQYA